MKNDSILKNSKPVFSGHETFPLRYGWLKKVFDASIEIENKKGNISKDLFNNIEAISILGVGKNMVASMRYWGIYTGVLSVNEDRNLAVSDYAKKIFADDGFDPWLENYATLWLIHWNLATNPNLFTYYWVFNRLNAATFDKDSLVASIQEALSEYDLPDVSPSTLKRDVECFLGVYSTRSAKEKSNEESIESPLTELALISPLTRRDLFQTKVGAKPNLSVYTFIFGLLMFWKFYSPNSKTLSLEAICYEEMSPGRIFLINENAIGDFAQNISEVTNGLLEWSETAGLKQILLKKDIDFEKEAFKIFERNYK